MSDPMITVHRHGEGGFVAELVLDRPSAMNAISTAMAVALAEACAGLAVDDQLRAVVVSSSHPKAFCVGADLKERDSFTDADLMAQRPIARRGYGGILNLPVPTIAAVDGFALGGGCEIALSCDMIVAGAEATLGLPEVSVGVIPGAGGTQLVTRRLGWSKAALMIFTTQRMSGAQAKDFGLVDVLTPAGGAREAALEMAERIAKNSPVGLRNAKKAMRLGLDVDLAAGLEIEDGCWRATAFSQDRAEGVRAFNEKRAPNWPGR